MARTTTTTNASDTDQGAARWWTLTLVCVAIFMLLLDITVVNVALPQIQHALHASFTDLQWVIDAYALALSVLVLNAGALSDIIGRKRIFVIGLGLFTLASLACGLSPTSAFLIAARAVQGIGGAIMFATSLALITQAFPPRERGTAFGIWGATTGAAIAIGPLVGGALTTAFDWRWIFFVNVPIGIVAVILGTRRLVESRDPRSKGIDWPGLFLLSGSLGMLVYALLTGNDRGWSSGLGLLVGAAVLMALFLANEARRDGPMMELALFRIPSFAAAQIVAFALSASMFAMFLYLTLYLQNVLGFSPLQAGLRLLPVSLLAFVFAPAAGRLTTVLPIRFLVGLGMGLVGTGLLLMTGVSPTSSWTALLAGFLFAGAGIGLTNPPLASTAIGVAPRERAGMASGVNNTFRQVGIATGIAALGAIFQGSLHDKIAKAVAGTPEAAHVDDLTRALSSGAIKQIVARAPAALREGIAASAKAIFVDSLTELFWVGTVIAFIGAVLALVLIRKRDFQQDQAPAVAAG
jgi:EmrB/QacA subfamily drug resistance transporter